MRRVHFILAIDSYLLRKGMAAILHRIPGASVVKEFDTVDLLSHYLERHGTDFLIISHALFEKATELYLADSSLLERTILLKNEPSVDDHEAPGDCGTAEDHGVPDKSREHIRECIYLSEGKEEIIAKIDELLNPYFRYHQDPSPVALTDREKTIVRFVSMGYTNKQIAGKLFLSTHTVLTHRKNIIHKLGIKSVSGLTVYAIVNNIITIDEVTSKHDQ